MDTTKNDSRILKTKGKATDEKTGKLRKCVICGSSFRSLYGSVACSQKCRDENRRKNERHRARRMRGGSASDYEWGTRECAESSCRKLFHPDKLHPEQMFCSKKCCNKRYRKKPHTSSSPTPPLSPPVSREKRNTGNGWGLQRCPFTSGEIETIPFGLGLLTLP